MILTIIFGVISVILGGYILFEQYNKKKSVIKKFKVNKEKKNQLIDLFIERITLARNLYEVLLYHVEMWANGIRHPNISPDKYGMFRTDDISLITPDQVHLGNIKGLWTKDLPYWANFNNEADRDIILKQYKNHLINNLKVMKS